MKQFDLTTIEGFTDFMAARSQTRIDTCLQKNHDYADPTNHTDDPYKVFRNFMMVEELHVCSAETGVVVRLTDKFMRMVHLCNPNHKQAVSDEALKDTMLDLQNYIDILAGIIELKQQQDKATKKD